MQSLDKMKSKILEHSTLYQIGGQPGHSHREHVFSIISIILKEEKECKDIISTAADIIKYFVKEDNYDVIEELYSIDMNQKLCILWFKLNSDTIIKVKTANGMTEEAYAGTLIGQGLAGKALNSHFNLDIGIQAYFEGSQYEYYYGSVRYQGVILAEQVLA